MTANSNDFEKPTVLCLMGPTASGKTALAERLAQEYPVRLISVDSAIIYRQLTIGAGKPEFPHALVNICDAHESYSAAQFCDDVTAEVRRTLEEQKRPCLVGGTMMYFRALQKGMGQLPTTEPDVRAKVQARLKQNGVNALWEALAAVDPKAANKIHQNDPQRICRALEVYEMTGRPISELQPPDHAPNFKFLNVGLWPDDRQWLHERINNRFDLMMEAGFLEEVQSLFEQADLHADLPSIRSVGYRQLWSYLENECSLPEAIEKAKAATRQLAKRQITWLRSWPELNHLDPKNPQCYEELVTILKTDNWL